MASVSYLVDTDVLIDWLNHGNKMIRQFKIIVEKHPDGYVAYPLGLNGVVVSEEDTYEEVLVNIKSAIVFHIKTFGWGG